MTLPEDCRILTVTSPYITLIYRLSSCLQWNCVLPHLDTSLITPGGTGATAAEEASDTTIAPIPDVRWHPTVFPCHRQPKLTIYCQHRLLYKLALCRRRSRHDVRHILENEASTIFVRNLTGLTSIKSDKTSTNDQCRQLLRCNRTTAVSTIEPSLSTSGTRR